MVVMDTKMLACFDSDNGEDKGIEETAKEKVKLYQRNGNIIVEGCRGQRCDIV